MTCGIYAIGGPNGYFYIGQSLDIERRFYAHYWQLRRSIHPCKALQGAWDDNPAFQFRFMIYGKTPEHGTDRFALEQHFLEQTAKLYNEAKRIIRTCAYYPKTMIVDAMNRFIPFPRVQFLTPTCDWMTLPETNYTWCACDAGTRDDNWFLGVVMDSVKWQQQQISLCDRFNMLVYNPTEEYKRLGKDKWLSPPVTRQAYYPYVFVRLNRGINDFYRISIEKVPISLLSSNKPVPISYSLIDDLWQFEDIGHFISTQAEREKVVDRHNLAGAKFISTDGIIALMSKNGSTFEVLLTDLTDLFARGT